MISLFYFIADYLSRYAADGAAKMLDVYHAAACRPPPSPLIFFMPSSRPQNANA